MTFTNGRITLTMDIVFGLSVLTEDGWRSIKYLDKKDKEVVRQLLDWAPGCPEAWINEVYKTES